MLFYLFIGFHSLCVITFIGIGVIFYKGMKANQKDEKKMINPQTPRPSPRDQ